MNSYAFLRQVLVAEFGVRPDVITPDATLASLGLDSLAAVELVRELEGEFGVVLTDEQADFSTLAEAAAIVDALVGGDPI